MSNHNVKFVSFIFKLSKAFALYIKEFFWNLFEYCKLENSRYDKYYN